MIIYPTIPPRDHLFVDPLLMIEAGEVYSHLSGKNDVWPGWNIRKTPILIYLPGKQDLLINHPKPPPGFHRFEGNPSSNLGPMWIQNDKTLIEFDGQNTSIDVNGVQTLVIADTLSTRRQWVEGLGGNTENLMSRGLYPNPYGGITMFAHEAFHVFQHEKSPVRGGKESTLLQYPSLSVVNNVGFALESEALARACLATTPEAARTAGLEWMAIRDHRRASLTPDCITYEDQTEFNEGLAKYVEFKFLSILEGKRPSKEMWWVQGFRGYEDLLKERSSLVSAMRGFLSGKNVVNGDLYGASPVRFRLYYSGMGIGALLDHLSKDWKEQVFSGKSTLTDLVRKALNPTSSQLADKWNEIAATEDAKRLTESKTKLAEDGAQAISAELAKLDQAPAELVIDYRQIADNQIGLSFTPFGILRVDDNRAFYRLIPLRGTIGKMSITQEGARPVLQDRSRRELRIPLTGPLPDLNQPLNGVDLALPGIKLGQVTADVRADGRRLILSLKPSA